MSKNRIIECLHCKKKVFELLKPIKDPFIDIVCVEHLKPIDKNIPIPKVGDLCRCPLCKEELFTSFLPENWPDDETKKRRSSINGYLNNINLNRLS